MRMLLLSFKNFEIPAHIPDWDEHGVKLSNEDILVTHNIREMQKLMNDYVGIVRSDFRLERAMRRLGLLHEETESFYKQTKLSVKLCELRNLIQVSYLVVKSAMARHESRGLHYTTDYPEHQEVLQDSFLMSYACFRAENGIRTRGLQFGKLMLYQLSYFR
jgi:L-aspartate oxidase